MDSSLPALVSNDFRKLYAEVYRANLQPGAGVPEEFVKRYDELSRQELEVLSAEPDTGIDAEIKAECEAEVKKLHGMEVAPK
jgi:hypothetical protein